MKKINLKSEVETEIKNVLSCLSKYMSSNNWLLEEIEGTVWENSGLNILQLEREIEESRGKLIFSLQELMELSEKMKDTYNFRLIPYGECEIVGIQLLDSSFWEIKTTSKKIIDELIGSFCSQIISISDE